MKAVLLAAGIGKRLEPISNSIPKPMIKIAGKPILEYILEDLIASGFDDFCIVVGHQSDKIKEYFQFWKKDSINITFVTQENLSGTANAVYCAKDFVKHEPFLIYLSDTLIPKNLQNILSEIKTNDSDISLISSSNFSNPSNSVGHVVTDGDIVIRLSEKSNTSTSNLAWAGLAFFNSGFIFDIIEKLAISKHGEFDITEAVNMALKQNKKIKNFTCQEFIDCGTSKGLLDGLEFILTNKYHTNQNNISHNSFEHTYIGTNCSFGKNVSIGPFVSLGDNVIVGDNVQISKSLVFNDTKIPSNSIISDSILLHEIRLSIDGNLL